jgi:hypothetical protein
MVADGDIRLRLLADDSSAMPAGATALPFIRSRQGALSEPVSTHMR